MHFNTTPRVVTFTVDTDEYRTKGALPAEVLFKLKSAFSGLKDSKDQEVHFEKIKELFARILTAESFALFEPRITGECDDDTVPIDSMMLIDISRYIITESGKGNTPPPAS